jgi:transposase-like protein
MARKATVDVAKVLQMLREGGSTQAVAEHFGVSRQAIDLRRRKFIETGQLVDKRAPRKVVFSSEGDKPEAKDYSSVSLDQLIDLAIEAFDGLKKIPKLEAELERYKQDYQKAAERIEQLEKEISKREAQEARWRAATLPSDASSPGKRRSS